MKPEIIPHEKDYMGDHVIYWFTDKKNIFRWVDKVAKGDVDRGTNSKPRFGGNFIDVEPEQFKRFISWVIDGTKKIGLAGYTGNRRDDLVIDEILLEPKEGTTTKELRRCAHIYRADEVSDEIINGITCVRCWWD